MATYRFKAIDQKQNVTADIIEASSEKEAKDKIALKRLKVIYLKEESKKKKGLSFSFRHNFSIKEKVAFCRYFALLINSGLPLTESFELLINETKNPLIKNILAEISNSVNQGNNLVDSFARFPKHFDDIFLAMIKTGESSATLSESFEYLYKQYKQENSLRQKVTSALIYPLVIVSLMGGVALLMFVFVLPKLAGVFLKMDIKLPLPTKILLETSLFFQKNILILLLVIVGLAVTGTLLALSTVGKKFFRSMVLKVPLIKTIFTQYNLARFTQSLAALIKGGVPIIESLGYSLRVISEKDSHIGERFKQKLGEGLPLAQIFSEEKAFPILISQMVAVGERSGELDKVLTDLSGFYQEEVENSLKNFVAILEPVLMVIIGIAVGVMVLAVISPIYSLIGQIQPK